MGLWTPSHPQGSATAAEKAGDAIEAGDMRVNWDVVKKKGTELKPGDLVSYAGKGRPKIIEVATPKRDRFAEHTMRGATVPRPSTGNRPEMLRTG